jgi:hypothetical protein
MVSTMPWYHVNVLNVKEVDQRVGRPMEMMNKISGCGMHSAPHFRILCRR